MYVRVSRIKRARGIYEYYQLVESKRVGTTVLKKIICSFGSTSAPTLPSSLLELFLAKTPPKLYAFPTAIYQMCLGDLALRDIFAEIFHSSRITSDVFLLTTLMIIHRIIDPDSKLALTRWRKQILLPVPIPEELDVSALYYTLDYLVGKKEDIEKRLFTHLKKNGRIASTIVFYDLTSSYFEGEEVPMSSFGYSRDKRPDRRQITLGLVLDKNGLPVYHEVFEGNMSDSKTVKGILGKLRETFGIQDVVFVADKGMLTPDNLKELEDKNYQSILSESVRNALSREQREELFLRKDTFTRLKGMEEILWYTETKDTDKQNVIVCYNQYTAEKAKQTRDTKIKKLETFITETKEKHKEKGGKKGEKKEIQKVRDMILAKLAQSHARKYFDTKDAGAVANLFPLKKEVIDREEQMDGMWIIRSKTKDLTAEQLITAYKDLKTIEASFRTIKDVIELRPIYHHKDDRVKGHVFICILAFLVTKLLEKKTNKSIKMLREEYTCAVALPGKKQPLILGGNDLLQAIR